MATTVDTLLVRIEADMSDLRRDLSKVAKHTETTSNRMGASLRKVGGIIASLGGAYVFGNFIKSTIQTGAQIEGLKVQLDALLGSAEQGAKAFDKMSTFASKVPFSLDQIQAGSGSLAAAAGDADQLGELLQVTGNIAAQFNIPFDQAAENVQRAMSAGAASADLFQQKGVNAFMGLQAGVSYSSSETAKVLIENFGTGGSADGAMTAFAKTTNGAMSMAQDAMFNLKASMASSGLNDGFIDLLNVVTDITKSLTPFAAMVGDTLGAALSTAANGLYIVTSVFDEFLAAVKSGLVFVGAMGASILEAFGVKTQGTLWLVSGVVKLIRDNMKLLVTVTGVYIGLKLGGAMVDTARAAVKLAAGLKSVIIVQRLLNTIIRRGLGVWIAIGVVLGEITGGTDALADKMAEVGRRVFDMLPEELKTKFENFKGELGDVTDAIQDARDEIARKGPLQLDVDAPLEEVVAARTAAIQAALMGLEEPKSSGAYKEIKADILTLIPEKDRLIERIASITAALPLMTNKLREVATEGLTVLKEQLKEMDPLYSTLKESTVAAFGSIGDSFADALVNGTSAMEGLKNTFKSFVKVMIAKALELYVFNSIINAAFGLSGQTALPTRTLFGRAGGGGVRGNEPVLVGERGPELFVPHSAGGKIMNNHNTKNAMGGGGAATIVNQTINVSAGVAQTVRAEMVSLLPRIKQETMSSVLDARQRGGAFASAFG
jgi:hypothetical protein